VFGMKKRMRLTKVLGLVVVAGLISVLTGCAASSPASRVVEMPAVESSWDAGGVQVKTVEYESEEVAVPARAPMPSDDEGNAYGTSAAVPAAVQRMIIQRASLQLVIKDTAQTMETIKDLVSELGGYIANSNAWEQEEWLRASLTLRVPVENLEQAIDRLKGLAVKVQRESLSGEDVTEQYTDLSAQLRNLEATETELLALLTEVRERPGSTAEDILDVHRRLTEIRGEIERVKGRMQYLEQMTALATIDVELVPDPLEQPVVEPGWAPLRTVTEASRSLVRTLKQLVDVVIWFVVCVLPVLLLIALPIVLLVLLIRWLVRRARSRKARRAEQEG
jgi:hypothetical protein